MIVETKILPISALGHDVTDNDAKLITEMLYNDDMPDSYVLTFLNKVSFLFDKNTATFRVLCRQPHLNIEDELEADVEISNLCRAASKAGITVFFEPYLMN